MIGGAVFLVEDLNSPRSVRMTTQDVIGHGPRGVTQRYVHLDAALVIPADQVSAEIAQLLDGGEVLSMKEAKRLRSADQVRSLAEV